MDGGEGGDRGGARGFAAAGVSTANRPSSGCGAVCEPRSPEPSSLLDEISVGGWKPSRGTTSQQTHVDCTECVSRLGVFEPLDVVNRASAGAASRSIALGGSQQAGGACPSMSQQDTRTLQQQSWWTLPVTRHR